MARAKTLMISYRLLQHIFIWRWTQTLLAAVRRVRLHPTALLLGSAGQFAFGVNIKVGARSVLDTDSSGILSIEDDVWISSDVEMQTSTKISIGPGTSIQRRCTINGTSRIGAGCILAPNVFISSGTHAFKAFPSLPIRKQEQQIALSRDAEAHSLDRAIWIQADCWLGTNVVVCPGVTIGKGSVIGANSVVTRDVSPYSIVAGSPAKCIGARLNWSPPPTLDAEAAENEIYVLDGVRVKGDDGLYGFIPDRNSACFVAALANGGSESKIRVFYRADAIVEVAVGEKEFFLQKGTGVLDVAATHRPDQAFAYLELRLSSRLQNNTLLISKVSVVSES